MTFFFISQKSKKGGRTWLSPQCRTKCFAVGHFSVAAGLPITAMFVHFCPPPFEILHPAWIEEAEKDDNDAKGQARVECRAQRHGVFAPPGRGAPLQDVVEDVADEGPDGEVEPRGRRDPGHGAKDHGQVDLADDAALLVAGVQPQRDGQQSTERETPHEGAVDGAGPEKLAGPYDTPQDGPVEVHPRNGTGEAVEGLGAADALDVGEHPVQDANLGDGRDERGDNLDEKHDSWRNLHVVAQFEIRRELDALRRGNITICDKNHVGDGTAGENNAANQLADQINATMLVRDCHDDAVWNEEDRSNAEGQEKAVPG